MNSSEDKRQSVHGGIHSLALTVATAVAAILLAIALLFSTYHIGIESAALQQTDDRYVACETAVDDMMETSTYLTTQSRLFATTHHTVYLDNYYWEMTRNERREADVVMVRENLPGSRAAEYTEEALDFSERLSKDEIYAMKLIVKALDLDVDDDVAAMLDDMKFMHGDELLPNDEMLEKAHMLVTSEPYEHAVDRVAQQIERSKGALTEAFESEKKLHEDALNELYLRQQVLTIILLVLVLFTTTAFVIAVFRPLAEYVKHIDRGERLKEKGAIELRFLAHSYNAMYDDNRAVRERLTHEAEHDTLTGLYNRGAFERDIDEHRQAPMAMIIIDVDHFKEVNDQYGHDIGDIVLKEMAASLEKSFEPDGTAYRLGGDEFVVIMPGTAEELRDSIERRARAVAAELARPHGEAPAVGVSAGVAFGDGTQASDDYYKRADKALYRVKGERGQGIAFDDEPGIRPFWN